MAVKFNHKENAYCNSTKTNKIDLDAMRATSYNWWPYMRQVNGVTIFNNNFYSASTSKHQNDCRRLLADKNINVDLMVDTSSHLDNLEGVIQELKQDCKHLAFQIRKPRTRKATNQQRLKAIMVMRKKINVLRKLLNNESP